MQIACDNAGKVWLVGEGLPIEWNGIELTVFNLTEEQKEAYASLQHGSATMFDGKGFIVLPPDPRDPILAQLAAIDQATLAAARGLREFILGVTAWAQAAKEQVPDLPEIPLGVGIQKIELLEQQAVVLRNRLAALPQA